MLNIIHDHLHTCLLKVRCSFGQCLLTGHEEMAEYRYKNHRREFLCTTTKDYKLPLREDWYKSNMKWLLDAHYSRMGEKALSDVEDMLATGDRKLTAQRTRKTYERVKVGSIARGYIEEWYQEKQDAGGADFEMRWQERAEHQDTRVQLEQQNEEQHAQQTELEAMREEPRKPTGSGSLMLELARVKGEQAVREAELLILQEQIANGGERVRELEQDIELAKRDEAKEKESRKKKRKRTTGERDEDAGPYAHKWGINAINVENYRRAAKLYVPDAQIDETYGLVLDGPDCLSTKALNSIGVVRVDIVNDDRHGDFKHIQAKVDSGEIRARAWKAKIVEFLRMNSAVAYNFILYDGHGWSRRQEEFDALLYHVAKPFCYFVATFQVKGPGVYTKNGPMQLLQVKKEPVSEDEDGGNASVEKLVTTNVYENKELEQFTMTMTRKMKQMNVQVLDIQDKKVPGRSSTCEFQVRVWHLDTRAMNRQPEIEDS